MARRKIVAVRLNIYAEVWKYQSCFNVEVSLREVGKKVKGYNDFDACSFYSFFPNSRASLLHLRFLYHIP
jgi:hypothetical protein